MAAVRPWPVPSTPYGRRGGWPVPWAPCGRRGGLAGSLHPVWLPLGRGRSPQPRMAAVGAWPLPWAPYGPCMAVVGAWLVTWALYGHRGGVALATIGCTVCTFSQLYCMHLAVECGVSYWILY